MKISTPTTLGKFQLSATVLLSILAVNLCLGMSDRATAIPATGNPIPSTLPTLNPTTTIPTTTTASGPICANVDINILNRTSDTLKLTSLEYLDADTNTFLPVNLAQQQLQSGTNERVTRDLAGLGRNERTKLRVTYQHKQGPNFAPAVRETTDPFVCVDGSTHQVRLNK